MQGARLSRSGSGLVPARFPSGAFPPLAQGLQLCGGLCGVPSLAGHGSSSRQSPVPAPSLGQHGTCEATGKET